MEPMFPRERPTFESVRDAVYADAVGKIDLTVPRREARYEAGRLVVPAKAGYERFALTNWASGQFCNRIGIPAEYFRRCPPQLQEAQADYWLRHGEKPDERWLLRTKGANIRAVLTDRYSPLDNPLLMDELRPLLPSSYRVDWFGLGGEALHLRVIDPSRYREVLPNDALTVGIHISNSEVGLRSVRVDALVYRLVCTNGLIRLVKGKSLMRQRHLAISAECFAASLGEAVRGALAESEAFLEQLRASTTTPVPDVEDALERIGDRWRLGEDTRKDVAAALRLEPASQQETLYGLVNAFTAVARSLPNEQRYDLEILAGELAGHGVNAYAPRKRRHAGDNVAAMEPRHNGHRLANGANLRMLPPVGRPTSGVAA